MNTAKQPYLHFQLHTDEQHLCWLTIDVKDTSTNVLSREVLTELEKVIRELHQLAPKALLIQSAKKNGFIAGADIHGFTDLGTRDEALVAIKQGQNIFTELERLPFPTIALIHGFCLGGGLELALSCTYRIAADETDTRIGLPEVKLGIHPGFGGTVRLTRLIGSAAALPLILSGRTLNARQAAKQGILTFAVPMRLLRSAGVQLALSQPKKPKPKLLARLADSSLGRSLVTKVAERKLRQKVRQSHYPAPYAVLDLWHKHGGVFDSMMEQEAQSVADLIKGETAQNLIRCFLLQERLKSLPGSSDFTPKHVHVIGAGVMGGDIAAWCALRGHRVSIQDNSHDTLTRSVQRAANLFKSQLKQPHLVTAALDRFIPDMKGDYLPKADVIIEAIYEDVTAKKTLFAAIEANVKKDVLLATNTSSIPLETLAAGLQHPERLVGLHFFNPVAKMQLVEVVSTSYSSNESVRKAIQFTKGISKLPLPVRSSPGFLVNRILMPYLHEAAILESEGIPAAAIDQAAEEFGMPIGPIELIDMVGLDICQSVVAYMGDQHDVKMPGNFQTLIQQGRLGKKKGAGYYTYSNNKPKKEKLGKGYRPPVDLMDRLILRLINESVACLREEVVSDGDLLDAGMVYGTGFAPFRGGVIHYVEKQSGADLHRQLTQLQQRYGDRFRPDPGWDKFM